MVYKNIILTPPNVSSQASVQKSQFYKGFSTANPTSQTTKLFDFLLIQQDIMNMFQTKKGERVMNPEFGTIIWELIYEPFTLEIKRAISEDATRIINYDPRVTPTDIKITEADTGMIIEATLYNKLENVTQQMILNFNAELGIVTVQ